MKKKTTQKKSVPNAVFLTWCTADGHPVKVVCAYDGPIDPNALEHLANAIFNRVRRKQISLEKARDAYQEGYLKLAQKAAGLLPPKQNEANERDLIQSTLSGITSNASRRKTLLEIYIENAIHETEQAIAEEKNRKMIRAILQDRVYPLIRNERERKILFAYAQTGKLNAAAKLLMQDKTSGFTNEKTYRTTYHALVARIQNKLGLINNNTKGN
jgi:hypothetical protein